MEGLMNGIKDLFNFGKKANEGSIASPEVDQLSGVDGLISGAAAEKGAKGDSGNFLASLVKILGI